MPSISLPTADESTAMFNQAMDAPIIPAAPAPRAPAAAAPMPQAVGRINVIDKGGAVSNIPADQLQQAIDSGYRVASEPEVHNADLQEKHGGTLSQLGTAAEGALSAATFGASTGVERAIGQGLGIDELKPEAILGRSEANPVSKMVGEGAGLAASALIPGAGAANILGKVGGAAAKALVPGATALIEAQAAVRAGATGAKAALAAAEAATPLAARIGSTVVRDSVENALFQSGSEVSKMLASDPNQSVETAMADIGLAGALGGVLGGSMKGAGALWEAQGAPQLQKALTSISKRMGGIDGQLPEDVEAAITSSGVKLSPEVKAGLANDPSVRQMFKTLEQSDTTGAGRELQETFKADRRRLSDSVVEALGHTPDSVPQEMSKAAAGKSIGETLAKEIDARIAPLSKAYDDIHAQHSKMELEPSLQERLVKGADPATTTNQGTIDALGDKLGKLAETERWTISPSSDEMKLVNNVMSELPLLKTVDDLAKKATQVGNVAAADPFNKPLGRAAGLIKRTIRDMQEQVIGERIGAEAGEKALSEYNQVRAAYAQQAGLRDALDSRLKLKASTSGYAKALKEAALTDGETLVKRLSDTGDADLLNLLQTHFPDTAKALQKHHLDSLLVSAVGKARPGEAINSSALIKAIEKMSRETPELADFVLPKDSREKISGVAAILDRFSELPHNFSNTARTMDGLFKYVPAGAAGMVTMLISHNPYTALLAGGLTKTLGKDLPDAGRLALLKWLGSGKKIDAASFGAMVHQIQSTIKGNAAATKAAKDIFNASTKVIISDVSSRDRNRKTLDKQVRAAKENPTALIESKDPAAYYLEKEGIAKGQTIGRALSYLQTKIPNTERASPLDKAPTVNPVQQASYNRALDIANHPLSVLESAKRGMLTPSDVKDLQTMYPALYKSLQTKVMSSMVDALDKEKLIPYPQRMALSMFLGQPLDSSMTPASIQSAQAVNQMPAGAGEMQGQGPKHTTSALNKIPSSYQTPLERTQANKAQKP